jgi:hypothetical protein
LTAPRAPPIRSRLMDRSVWCRPLLAASACTLLTGCPSFATLKTARALDPGQLQVTEAMEVLGMTAPANKGIGGVRPAAIVAARYGVFEGLDVGFRAEPVGGLSGDTTIQLVRGKVMDLALAPGAGYFLTPGPISFAPRTIEVLANEPVYTIWSTTLPVLVGFNFGQGHQVVLAPRATVYFVQPGNSGGQPRPGGVETFLGGSFGISFKTSHTLRVMPEIDVTAPVSWTGRGDTICTPGEGDCSPFNTSALIVQGGLAFTVGADNLGP